MGIAIEDVEIPDAKFLPTSAEIRRGMANLEKAYARLEDDLLEAERREKAARGLRAKVQSTRMHSMTSDSCASDGPAP